MLIYFGFFFIAGGLWFILGSLNDARIARKEAREQIAELEAQVKAAEEKATQLQVLRHTELTKEQAEQGRAIGPAGHVRTPVKAAEWTEIMARRQALARYHEGHRAGGKLPGFTNPANVLLVVHRKGKRNGSMTVEVLARSWAQIDAAAESTTAHYYFAAENNQYTRDTIAAWAKGLSCSADGFLFVTCKQEDVIELHSRMAGMVEKTWREVF